MKYSRLGTVSDVAEKLSVSASSVRRMVDRGEMPSAISLGRCRRFDMTEIDRWIDEGCPDQRLTL